MPSSKLLGFALVVLMANAQVLEVGAAPASEAVPLDATTQTLSLPDPSLPDPTRIASDLNGHYFFGGAAALGAGAVRYDELETSAVRSSLRNDNVLEFRVSSLFHEASDHDSVLEVDSVVTYRMDGGRWALLGVKTEQARPMNREDATAFGEDC